jgi:peptidyl-tRNA hydrolase, PTH1 family
MPEKYLITGLGNIGSEYAGTRHNIGFDVVDVLASELAATFSVERHAAVANIKVKNKTALLIKPTTYMNLSGKAVKYWLDKENIPLENLLVIADDLDLDPGILRLRSRGSGGSHNGLNHIIETLGTADWARLRFGIGKDFARGFQVEYVLGRWSSKEIEILKPKVELATEMVKSFILAGAAKTMSDYNNK